MEEMIIMTVLSFDIVAAMFLVAYLLKKEMPKVLYIIGLAAIVPTMIGMAWLIAEVQKVAECKEKYELIQEPVYRKIE